MAKQKPPASGERGAILGFDAQYRLAASLTLEALRGRRLEWVKMADPSAGRVDDFQLATDGRLDAYQFKWTTFPGTVTYLDLTKTGKATVPGGTETPALIHQLADGWKRLGAENAGRRVVVHLVTNEHPSGHTSATLTVGNPPPADKHLAAFFAQAWTAVQRGEPVPTHWEVTLKDIRQASGLTADEFQVFACNCRFDFGAKLPNASTEPWRDQNPERELNQLRQFYQDTVASSEKLVTLSVGNLLSKLGWASRFEFHNRHDFPDPGIAYVAIEATSTILEERLAELTEGYIALEGPPGSGKSTLLTDLLRRNRPERVVRYYAYVPDSRNPGASRGEAVNFLHDVSLAFQRMGVGASFPQDPGDLFGWRTAFGECLNRLAQEYKESGRRTIVLIDGLDHISRELRPERSLLAELPLPGQLPEGIIFVLGTQTDQLPDMPPAVRLSLHHQDRRVVISKLDRDAVLKIARNSSVHVRLSETQTETIFRLSDGHPLALTYLLALAAAAGDAVELDAALENENAFRGDIETLYQPHWDRIRTDTPEGVPVLAAISRMRTPPDSALLEKWFGHECVRQSSGILRRYMRAESDGRWRFFHNSFRLYLERESSRSQLTRELDPQSDRHFHASIAEKCAREPADSPHRWDELFHLIRAGEHARVCRMATTEYFRRQLLSGRSLDAIRTDTILARQAAAHSRDILTYARLVFAIDEWRHRDIALEGFDSPTHWLRMRRTDLAIEAIRDGNRLRVGDRAALSFSARFAALDMMDEARRLFDLAEPLDLLTGTSNVQREQYFWETLLKWADVVTLFRPLAATLERIAVVPFTGRTLSPEDRARSERRLRVHLLGRVGHSLIRQDRWDELGTILERVNTDGEAESEVSFDLLVEAARSVPSQGSFRTRDDFLRVLRERYPPAGLSDSQRVSLAELLADSGDRNSARSVLGQWMPAFPEFSGFSGSDPFDRFDLLYRHSRLLKVLGDSRTPMQLVPRPPRQSGDDVRHFLSDILLVAHIEAEAASRESKPATTIPNRLMGLLRRFELDHNATRDRLYWYACQAARGALYHRLVLAVSGHGPDALDILRNEFASRWAGDSLRYWPPNVRREVILAFFEADGDRHRTWALARLDEMESGLTADTDSHGAVISLNLQAEAWAAVDSPEKIGPLYLRAVDVSSRLSGEDYQTDRWMEAFDRFATHHPEEATKQLGWLADGLYGIRESADGGVVRSAAERLIRTAASLRPGAAIDLFARFRDEGLLDHADGLCSLCGGMLNGPKPPLKLIVYVVGDLIVPFQRSPDGKLLEDIIRSIHTRIGPTLAQRAVDYLSRRIERYGYPGARSEWFGGLSRACESLGLKVQVGSSAKAEQAPLEVTSNVGGEKANPLEIRFREGASVSLDRVIQEIGDVDRLVGWATDEYYTSAFEWGPVLDRMVEVRHSVELRRLLVALRRSSKTTRWLLDRARASTGANGGKDLNYAQIVLENTSASDWSRRYSGGHRLDACQILINADPVTGREAVWNALGKEACSDPPAAIELVALLGESDSSNSTWELASDRLRVVFDFDAVLPPARDPIAVGPEDSAAEGLANLLVHYSDHPVCAVRSAARRACGYALCDRVPEMSIVVSSALAAAEGRSKALVEILASIQLNDPTILVPFHGELSVLCNSPDISVAITASRLCGLQMPPFTSVELPAAYLYRQLRLPPRHLEVSREISPGEPLPDSDTPNEILGTVQHILVPAAVEAGVDFRLLLERGVRLMRVVEPENKWSAEGERQVRVRLENAGLKLTFTRPRSRVANIAARLILGELWRAGRLGEETATRLAGQLRGSDPGLLFVEPARRPREVEGIERMNPLGDDEERWVDEATSGLSLFQMRTLDGHIVLAELSQLEILARIHRSEERRSVVGRQGTRSATFDAADDSPSDAPVWLVRDYQNLDPGPRFSDCLVLRHRNTLSDSLGSGWLAFNPALARKFGWKSVPDPLFRWADSQGRLMVETIWWEDGPVGARDRWTEETVGRGWMVLASATAHQQIVDYLGQTQRQLWVTRSADPDDGNLRRTVTKTEVTGFSTTGRGII